MQRSQDWAWPMYRRTWCSPTWERAFSNAYSRIGAPRIADTTSITQAGASPRRRLRYWSMRYAIAADTAATRLPRDRTSRLRELPNWQGGRLALCIGFCMMDIICSEAPPEQ